MCALGRCEKPSLDYHLLRPTLLLEETSAFGNFLFGVMSRESGLCAEAAILRYWDSRDKKTLSHVMRRVLGPNYCFWLCATCDLMG